MTATETVAAQPIVSVIVPARNEEACLGTCLESLASQTGISFEIIVVDDHSTDRTREIAASFSSVRVIEAGPLHDGWTGKNNAVVTGAHEAHSPWLLFTDADTVHLPGSLARALTEAQENKADLLSYSPEQTAVTFWEMATLPVVFAELARQYPPSKVSDPNSPAAAANGQYILVKRKAYDAVGGHAAIAGSILEDVALARAVKASGRKIRFRYAADAVRTRMYRNYRQLRDGWTKNLALLFPNPEKLAAIQVGMFLLVSSMAIWTLLCLFLRFGPGRWATVFPNLRPLLSAAISGAVCLWNVVLLYLRVRSAHFPPRANVLAPIGLLMFAYLLLRSKRAHAKGNVPWKGRTYSNHPQQDASGGNSTDGEAATRSSLLESHH